MISGHRPQNQIDQLLMTIGLGTSRSIESCQKSGNNRLYRVITESGIYAAKQYFNGEGDLRDRLGSEFAFLTYAQSVNSTAVPKSYGYDKDEGLAIYEFIDGQPFLPGSIGEKQVNEAADFFISLNQSSQLTSDAANALPYSAEACFSIKDHIDLVSGRLDNLMGMPRNSCEDQAAFAFVEKLWEYWFELGESIRRGLGKESGDFRKELQKEARCVSPSDFGFHNALAAGDDKTYFIDFEYAGWDDPSRMVADFFSQLAVPVPDEYFNTFSKKVMSVFPEPDALIERASLLLPVYRVKWCCIALNVFLPKHLKRRLFANPGLRERDVKQEQLQKAEAILKSVYKGDTDGLY